MRKDERTEGNRGRAVGILEVNTAWRKCVYLSRWVCQSEQDASERDELPVAAVVTKEDVG